jgi:hypothetical protein
VLEATNDEQLREEGETDRAEDEVQEAFGKGVARSDRPSTSSATRSADNDERRVAADLQHFA